MKLSPAITFLIFATLIIVSWCGLRAAETLHAWAIETLALRGLLIGLLSAFCMWCCRKRLSPAPLALIIVALAAAGALASDSTSADLFQIWFIGLVIQLATVCLAYIALTTIPDLFDGFFDILNEDANATRAAMLNDSNSGEQISNELKSAWQISLRDIISVTTAVAIVIACFAWLSASPRTIFIAVMMFGCCGMLTALNFWSATRYDSLSGLTGMIVITLGAGVLLKFFELNLQQWLSATMLFLFIQLTILASALIWPAVRMKLANTLKQSSNVEPMHSR